MVYAGWMIVLGGLVFARRFYVLPALSASSKKELLNFLQYLEQRDESTRSKSAL